MTKSENTFTPPQNNPDIEEGEIFSPKFDEKGLIAAITQDAKSGDVLMFAYMNAEALQASLKTGYAHYYSRSRGKLWFKGETSNHRQKIISMLMDCDQDAIILKVETEATGANCHTGRKSCFYRQIISEQNGIEARLQSIDDKVLFDPKEIYKK